jgi:hypothetical protein
VTTIADLRQSAVNDDLATELTTDEADALRATQIRLEKVSELNDKREMLMRRIKGSSDVIDHIARVEPEAFLSFSGYLAPFSSDASIEATRIDLNKIEAVINAYFVALQRKKAKAAEAQEPKRLAAAHERRIAAMARLKELGESEESPVSSNKIMANFRSNERKILRGTLNTDSQTLNGLLDRLEAAITKAETPTTAWSSLSHIVPEDPAVAAGRLQEAFGRLGWR